VPHSHTEAEQEEHIVDRGMRVYWNEPLIALTVRIGGTTFLQTERTCSHSSLFGSSTMAEGYLFDASILTVHRQSPV
jgi:hypothetical protein